MARLLKARLPYRTSASSYLSELHQLQGSLQLWFDELIAVKVTYSSRRLGITTVEQERRTDTCHPAGFGRLGAGAGLRRALSRCRADLAAWHKPPRCCFSETRRNARPPRRHETTTVTVSCTITGGAIGRKRAPGYRYTLVAQYRWLHAVCTRVANTPRCTEPHGINRSVENKEPELIKRTGAS